MLISSKLTQRNIRLITELDSLGLSIYWVKTWIIDIDSFKSKASAISIRMSVYTEWWGYDGS